MAAPVSTFSYHIFGPVIVQTSFNAAPFVLIGECRDGLDLIFRPFTHDVKHDGGGGPEGDAVEILWLNFSVEARCQLVPYAGVGVNQLRSAAAANGGVEGTMVTPGSPMGLGGFLPAIKITPTFGADVDGGWLFSTCQVTMPGNLKAGVTESMPDFGFRAINYIAPDTFRTAGSIVGNSLYSRT